MRGRFRAHSAPPGHRLLPILLVATLGLVGLACRSAVPASSPTPVLARVPTPAPTLPVAPATGTPPASPTPGLAPPPGLPAADVARVIDGDTVDVRLKNQVVRVRLIGIDAPELIDPRRPAQCFGREAAARAEELLRGQQVQLEADPSQGDVDVYGRALRYVWLSDGRLFNLEMIRHGFAREYTFDRPYKYRAIFQAAQAAARAEALGLWSPVTCNGNLELPTASPSSATPVVGVQFEAVNGAPPGGRASVSVRAAAGAACSIRYTTPAGNPSTAAGLIAKTADETGAVSWSWVIGTSTRPGTGQVTVTCNGQSASTPITIR
jgi:micrococcal nuclease